MAFVLMSSICFSKTNSCERIRSIFFLGKRKFITATVAARQKSNNPFIKFTEEDGVWIINKRKSLDFLPEYKRRMLAKELGIKPYSPTAISSKELKAKLLALPNLEDSLYILASGNPEV